MKINKELELEILRVVYSKMSQKEIASAIIKSCEYYMRPDNDKVKEFHAMFNLPVGNKPGNIDESHYNTRINLIEEELQEYKDAWEEGDLVEMADALADLKYVVIGTEVEHGFPGDKTFDEVHRSNMTKEDGWLDENGKWQKGPSFDPPKLKEIILS